MPTIFHTERGKSRNKRGLSSSRQIFSFAFKNELMHSHTQQTCEIFPLYLSLFFYKILKVVVLESVTLWSKHNWINVYGNVWYTGVSGNHEHSV